ncbi:MAG: hypothetical protein JOZ52_10015 [Acidobacteria bacterium]|nr:hypothetical protein [Acidobacteriota bacterium]
MLIIILALVLILMFVGADWFSSSSSSSPMTLPQSLQGIKAFLAQYQLYLLLSIFFGALIGAAEIVSRYRDEPVRALTYLPGLFYMAFNGAISASAFFLLMHFKDKLLPGVTSDPFLTSVVAGFGAMAIMRSKLFNFKTEAGESFSLGPDAVLNILLSTVDRQIDRHRSADRQELVYNQAINLKDPSQAPDFFNTFLVSYQNLSDNEKKSLAEIIKKIYENSSLSNPRLRFMAASFAFLNIMGEKNFKDLIMHLRNYQSSPQNTSDIKTSQANNPSSSQILKETAHPSAVNLQRDAGDV